MSDSEFSRGVRVDTIGAEPRTIEIAANEAERAALARRFGLQALGRLEAIVAVHRAGQDFVAKGRMIADIVQSCVASGAPVPARIDEPFELLFRTEDVGRGEDEVELDEREMDVIFFDGAMLDVGEAVAQTLALALDPYPRADDAVEALREAGVKDEGEAGPFGALAGLRDKLRR